VFGSAARGTLHDSSDLDLAVEFVGPVTLPTLGTLLSQLEAVAGRPVDLVRMDRADVGVAWRVFRDGRLLVENDHAALVRRKARTMVVYLDFEPYERLLANGVLARASHGG